MSARRTARRLALGTTIAAFGLLAMGGSALAGEVSYTGTVLTYTASAGDAEDLTVSTAAGAVVFDDANLTLTAAPASTACVAAGGDVTCDNTVAYSRVVLDLGNQDDVATAAAAFTLPITASGGAGNDQVTGGDAADVLNGDAGIDTVSGGAGNDRLIVSGTTDFNVDDVINGNAGADVLDASSMVAGMYAVANGGADNDTITGGAGAYFRANGGDGNDALTSGTGDGAYAGNDGDDALVLTPVTIPSAVAATADGGAGNDTLTGGAAANFLFGGSGNDTINGGSGSEYLAGEEGLDNLNGGDGDDRINGGSVTATHGPNPTTVTTDGADAITGGAGFDTVDYADRTTAVNVNLAVAGGDGQANENDNVALDVEAATGGRADDVLTGAANTNTLTGGPGKDTIDGGASFDLLYGGTDADTINASADLVADLVDCGTGFTEVAGATPIGTDADTANLDYLDVVAPGGDCEVGNRALPPSGAPQVGTPGDDIIIGTKFADLIIGGLGNDTLKGGTGNDTLYGGAGNDTIGGWTGNDLIDGGFGNDKLSGDADADTINGGEGNDKLAGGPGVDTLTGGIGADRLDGGTGKDFLVSRDGSRARDTVVCSKVPLRSQRDLVVADRTDYIANRSWCGRIVIV
jgi:Ca2+-binding RTX toxin-like protein